jgi:hypothetical protein
MKDRDSTQEYAASYSVSISFDAGNLIIGNGDIIELYFVEDIYSFTLSGKLQFFDRHGVVEFGPLTGNEMVHVSYGTGDGAVERSFMIYKVSEISPAVTPDPTARNAVQFFFVDPLFMALTAGQYSRSWGESKVSDIVRDITEKICGARMAEVEESNESIPCFTMPYWSCVQAIKWLMRRASGSRSGNSGYLYFSSTKGAADGADEGVRFVTLESLLTETNRMRVANDDDGLYSFEGKNTYFFNKVLDYSVSGIDKLSVRALTGGHRLGFDPMTKQFLDRSYTYGDQLERTTVLGKKSLFNDISKDDMRFVLEGERDPAVLDNMYYDEWVKRYCLQQTVSITVRGHEGRHAGGIVEIAWPSNFKVSEKFNSGMEGGYLVKSVTHHFSSSNPFYTQKMVLIKNGYQDSNDRFLMKAKKVNLLNRDMTMTRT